MAYTIVVPGNMASTNVDSFLKSVQLSTEVENGAHIVLGDLLDENLDTYVAATPTAVDTQEVLIVESPIIIEVEGMRIDVVDPRKFINAKDRPLRARHLKVGDVLVMSIDGFSSAPTVNQFAVPANGKTKLDPASAIGSTTLVYKVEKKTAISVGSDYVEAYQLRVIKSV